MTLRLFVEPLGTAGLAAGTEFELPQAAARHAQVRRVQPGDAIVLFDGGGVDWPARVLAMGRRSVRVRVGEAPLPAARELPWAVTLAFGMPANERMDALVEKATELGAASLQPLLTARSVLRLAGERAERRREHWLAVAIGACEQCGRASLPQLLPVSEVMHWLAGLPASRSGLSWVLSTDAAAMPWASAWRAAAVADTVHLAERRITLLSGPEGGLTPAELAAASAAGFAPVSLGPRVLRADTAPLAALAWIALAVSAREPD